MSLRTRLTLGFLLVASLLMIEGFVAVRADRRIEYHVSQLERSSVVEVHHASAMALALQRAKTAAEELLTERYRLRLGPGSSRGDERSPEDVEAELGQGLAVFEQHLQQSRAASEIGHQLAQAVRDSRTARLERNEISRWLQPIAVHYGLLEAQIEEFQRLAAADPVAAHRYLNGVLGPQFRERLLPLVDGYREDAMKELSEEARRITADAAAAATVGIVTSAAAAALALLLGFTVARSIARPILLLGRAAERLGQGDLTSRVEIPGTSELGVLAATFNRMAEDLSATTVSRGYLRNVIESMAGALIITDSTARILSVNRATLDLLGHEAEEELAGEPLSRLFPRSAAAGGGSTVTRLRALEAQDGVEEVLLRKDGSEVAVAFSGATLCDEQGRLQGFVCVAHDITERKKVEARLRAFLREKELLLREVHHRVKNNLQVVSSLLDLQSSAITDVGARKAFQGSQDRIRSMALIHEQLHQTTGLLAEVDFRAYVQQLSAYLLESYAVHPDRIALRLDVEDLPLDVDQAMTCGLIINELVANALKHAFSPTESGEVRITFHRTSGGGYRLVVADNGHGLEKDFTLERSDRLGLSLVSTLVQQLHGRMELHGNGGTELQIEFSPLRADDREARHGG